MTGVSPIPTRECGACTACCSALTIDHIEIQKDAGRLCKNCHGAGCKIYDDRPTPCRLFYCAWRLWPSYDLSARPDVTGVLPLIDFTSREASPAYPAITLMLYGNDRAAAIQATWLSAFARQAFQSGVKLYLGLAAPPGHSPLRTLLNGDDVSRGMDTPEAVGELLTYALRFLEAQSFHSYSLQNRGNDLGSTLSAAAP